MLRALLAALLLDGTLLGLLRARELPLEDVNPKHLRTP